MSLKKLFNIDYFIQNMKKSKLAILLFLLVVPIFTSLLIITTGSELFESGFMALGSFNIFFMYVTPFILSLSLFGYVYKKQSADFMGSMPISRKTVFFTNTFGGMIIIFLMQLITMLITFFLFWITKGSIFSALVFDIFLYQTVAYIFMYAVCNLAMSVSGNYITQIVVVLLILFVIPASVLFFHADSWGSYFVMDKGYDFGSSVSVNSVFNFTAPSLIANGVYYFNTISLVKMLVMSAIYIAIGYYAFEHKKLECAGESFESAKTHMIVKGLTLIPFSMLLVALVDEEVWEPVLFLIAIVAVYYLVYDLLTNKKNKLLINMGAMIASLILLFGVYHIVFQIGSNYKKMIDINAVKSYSITDIGYSNFFINNEKFTDIDLLRRLLSERENDSTKYDGKYRESVHILLDMKDGSKVWLTAYYISDRQIREMLSLMSNQRFSNNCIITSNNNSFDKNQTSEIINEINQLIEKEGMDGFYQRVRGSSNRYMHIYSYMNHHVYDMGIPIDLTEKIFQIVTQMSNERAYRAISANRNKGYYLSIANPEVLEKEIRDYYYGNTPQEILDIVVNSQGKACNLQQKYVLLRIGEYEFYTNEVEQVSDILKKNRGNNIYDLYDNDYLSPATTEISTIEYDESDIFQEESAIDETMKESV